MLSTAQQVPSRSDGSHSLEPWQAMRSTASESPIQRLLHLSSPFGAVSRAEVVDAEEYKANCPTVLGARNFFHFQIEISPRRARTVTLMLRQSTVEVIPSNRIVFPFRFSGQFSNTESSNRQENTTSTKVRKAVGHSGSKKKANRPCDTPAESS